MLYSRYGNPLDLLNSMIATGRLVEFIDELIKLKNEEVQEKTQWEYYLHRIYDMSFDEFVKASNQPKPIESKVETTEIIEMSRNILKRTRL